MNLAECREELAVVPSEVAVERLVGVYAEELTDDLDGEDLGVGKRWGGAALTDTPSFELIVHQTEETAMMKVLRSTSGDLRCVRCH
jgi:hypothetical protein